MVNQRRKDFLVRRNKGNAALDKYLSGVSKAIKRTVSKADLISLEETDRLLANDFVKSVLSCSSFERIFPEEKITDLIKSLKSIVTLVDSSMCYLHLSHFGDTCGFLYLSTNDIIERLVDIVRFDGDDVYIYDLGGGNAIHLEYLTNTYIESRKRYGNSFELRLYGSYAK